jgi:hypothetical protein
LRQNRTPGRQSQGKADGVTPVGFFWWAYRFARPAKILGYLRVERRFGMLGIPKNSDCAANHRERNGCPGQLVLSRSAGGSTHLNV